MDVLRQSPLVKSGSIWFYDSETANHSVRQITWAGPGTQGRGSSAYCLDGVLVYVGIGLDYDDLTLQEAVERFGPAETVSAILYVDGPGSYSYQVALNLPSRGLSLIADMFPVKRSEVLAPDGRARIAGDMIVTRAQYYPPEEYIETLRVLYAFDETSVQAAMRRERPWTGFGQVELACGVGAGPECKDEE